MAEPRGFAFEVGAVASAAFSAIVDESPDSIFAKDLQGRYLMINRAGAAVVGRSVADVVGRTDLELFSPETARQIIERDRGILAGSHPRSYEAHAVTNGVARWFMSSKHLLRAADGTTIGLVGISRDITERRHMEEALAQSRESLQEAQAIARVGSWVSMLTPDERLLWSLETHRIFGTDPAGELGVQRFWALVHPDDRPRVEAASRAALADDAPYSIEHRVLRADGTIRWVHERASVVRDAHGRALRMVGTVQDVTELKEIQTRLVLADRMATVGTLAAGVGHEINNPLSFVAANLEFVREQLEQLAGRSGVPELRSIVDALADAGRGAERVRDIARGLKTFSRGEERSVVALDLRAVAELAISMAMSEIKHRARLVRELHPAPVVHANEARLGQVFLNLLINAAQALPVGSAASHEIRVRIGTHPDGRALVEISDTGAGMEPEVQRRIFDAFFTTKPVGVGHGLGLSICHGIVTGLGGEIVVDSAPGRGTTMRVLLPAGVPVVPEEPRRTPVAAPAPAPARRSLLVVDDEPLIGRTVQRLLGRDHDVTVSTSAREALGLISGGRRFDLVLCDLMMPDMTGVELHAALRALPGAPAAAAESMVFMTGGAFTPETRAFLDRVGNRRIAKPFDVATLRRLMAGEPGVAEESQSAG